MCQIVMITDGKSFVFIRLDGCIYRNVFGLDFFIVFEIVVEVVVCRNVGIFINMFMLAWDYDLVSFVWKVVEICYGKVYFMISWTFGRYVFMDYMDKKTWMVY